MLHTPTLLLLIILVPALLAVCLSLVAQRDQRDGLRYWALGLGAHAACYALFALRGQVSNWLSIVLANGLLSAYPALVAEGLYQFQDRKPVPRWLIWSPVLAVMVVFSLLLNHIDARIGLSSLILSVQAGALVWLVWRDRQQTPGRGQYFVIAGYLLVISLLLLRLWAVLGGSLQAQQIADPSQAQARTFIGALLSVILVSLGLVLMAKERADARNQSLALEDALTLLPNRRAVLLQLEQHLARAKRQQTPLSLLLFDIDHFKQVNDQHGHLSGDRVLRDMAACLRKRLRAHDVLGRWGGEEFMLLTEADAAGALQLAEHVRQSVAQTVFHTTEGQALTLTLSIGLHTRVPEADTSSDSLISAADAALYRAKQNGRNRVEQG